MSEPLIQLTEIYIYVRIMVSYYKMVKTFLAKVKLEVLRGDILCYL